MLTWEQSSAIIKTNFDQTKAYFEKIVKATDVYKQNTGINSVPCNKYESANQMATYGNKLWEWIQLIASNGANNELAANTQATDKIASMESEIKKLMAAITQMANKSTARTSIPTQAVAIATADAPRIRNHVTWAGTATLMATTLLVPTTPVQTAVGKRTATMTKQRGPMPLVETHSGHLQSMLQSISNNTPHGRANQLPPIDRDRG